LGCGGIINQTADSPPVSYLAAFLKLYTARHRYEYGNDNQVKSSVRAVIPEEGCAHVRYYCVIILRKENLVFDQRILIIDIWVHVMHIDEYR
jgi:hypothetical protein